MNQQENSDRQQINGVLQNDHTNLKPMDIGHFR